MALAAVRSWFGHSADQPREIGPRTAVIAPSSVPDDPSPIPMAIFSSRPLWTAERLAVTDELWGEGYQSPGGEIEALRLARPLGLSAGSSLLLLGAGGGGASCSIASQLGVWVAGFEADADLAAAAEARIGGMKLTRRTQIESWDPEAPELRARAYHHGLALEPLRGARPERVLTAIEAALKPGGQLMISELVAETPLNPADPDVARWARLEQRDPAALPSDLAITRILGRLGFDVRIVEDISQRHIHDALTGWRATLRSMGAVRPARSEARAYIREAELWLMRLRLFQLGRLRLVRWHAIKKP